ncbi:D-2-hydroxyacid dehydrogenase [Parageobacillus thermoglucosidasius]|uniref:Hydroxyacid dehydrogenase n=1 Tax=Parageobacillus thermoglucosidasius TaxID=1426 RepID=A0AAN0YTJ1_PARTM|nr:D-2-hydroxyacid dehydrogenase [Parageobacillus thermoglucosidasius]ALF11095.1 hydroxyacid dehydrogenase [Parageobacillus thermoglucosidasius]ANZ31173.1 hydroxyacid dehydrogenase [Parageobacillus thermoglucosidasius]APM81910.1 hydroxyacid dehydrogenase [Parageobacillus thermoglucosidasius]KJX68862.1 2-hydroxyacid dehydrogenase [Parageobacillus thermoglucosidasius]RDE25650.1 D-2-hydroxyacid dehydrogenase [Parageobacillus thermoglucosidasius]
MSNLSVKTKKISPNVYIRIDIPQEYIDKLKEICSMVIVEPWKYGQPEPVPSSDLSECNVILTLGLHDPLHILKNAPNVQWVQSISVGTDAMINDDVINSDVIITNTKGCTSVPIAEHTIAMITSFARGVPTMIRNQKERKWERIPVMDLENATVGIIGYGEIGFEIAKRCRSLGMQVIGCRRNLGKKNREFEPANIVVGMDQVDDVISHSDFLVLALPSTRETVHFFNRERLRKMKQGSYLINVGRGNTVVEEDLIECLINNRIAGAALDVFEVEPLPKEHPFWQLENVIVSPHNAYYSPKTMDRYMDLFMRNLKLFSEGKPLINIVDKQLGY